MPMQGENSRSFASLIRHVTFASADLIRSEARLARAEFRESVDQVRDHMTQIAIFGGLTAIGVLPFVAFLVIGLGKLLDENYWLSSLIVSFICSAIFGALAYRAYRKLRARDLSLPRTRETVSDTVRRIGDVRRDRAA